MGVSFLFSSRRSLNQPKMHCSLFLCAALAVIPVGSPGEPVEQTPAEAHVARALRMVAEHPAQPGGYDELALGLSRRARESADPEYYQKAMDALGVSRHLDPDGYRARKVRAWVLLGQHRFREALEVGNALISQVPDDLQLYCILVDANVELGNYAEAEAACQWLLDLRPGNVPGLARAAHLRELFGDVVGARELMQRAYHSTAPREKEDRAWLLTQLAELDLQSGWPQRAQVLAQQALGLFPDYHYALAAEAKALAAQENWDAALKDWERRYELAPHPENLFDVAMALRAVGRDEEASAAFRRFEEAALLESGAEDNANRSLVRYYIEVADRPQDALRLARSERSRRSDVVTRMHLAWAAFHAGEIEFARSEAEEALEVGTCDPELRLWAARIALSAGDHESARAHAQALLTTAPLGAAAEEARQLLDDAPPLR